MRWGEATPAEVEGKRVATPDTWGAEVVRLVGVMPGSPFVWVWGRSLDPLNDDLHRWVAFYPADLVSVVRPMGED